MQLIWFLCVLVVVGNKNDSPDKKVVSTDDAQKFAEQIGVELYESSAKENINVEEVHVHTCTVYILIVHVHCIRDISFKVLE